MRNDNAECRNTHAGKAGSYDLGRPEYPAAFYDYLYGEFGLHANAVIADIGAGPGKIARGFLERGSRVYAVEPDDDMRRIAQERLGRFDGCTVLGNCAEETGIPTGSADLIFCVNSYYWFDRTRVVPEFKRILKSGEGANVVLAWLRGSPKQSEELYESLGLLIKPMDGRHDESPPFREGAFTGKEFNFTLFRDLTAFMNGMLSASFSLNPGDDGFEEYCQIIKRHFERYSRDEKLETKFKLTCMIGNVNALAEG
jgi:SAM-dependent methyltransferase